MNAQRRGGDAHPAPDLRPRILRRERCIGRGESAGAGPADAGGMRGAARGRVAYVSGSERVAFRTYYYLLAGGGVGRHASLRRNPGCNSVFLHAGLAFHVAISSALRLSLMLSRSDAPSRCIGADGGACDARWRLADGQLFDDCLGQRRDQRKLFCRRRTPPGLGRARTLATADDAVPHAGWSRACQP